jgi:ribonuclease E
MSRQRLRPSLGESSHIVCPRCVGIGSIRSVESMTLAVLRLIGEELRKDRTARVIAQVPVAVATYLINEKREWLRTLEDKSGTELIIVPNENIQTPEYSIKRVRDDEMELPENKQATYLMPTAPELVEPGSAQDQKPQPEAPAVATLLPATAAPVTRAAPATPAAREHASPGDGQPAQEGFWTRFKRLIAGAPAPPATPQQVAPAAPSGASRRDDGQRRDGRREFSRHGRYAEGARRGRGEGRDRDRSRGRDAHDSRGREPGRGGRDRLAERGSERGPERDAERGAPSRDLSPSEDSRQAADRVPGAQATPSAEELRGERSDRGERRGRRGRRRGRRGGGGSTREGVSQPPGVASPATESPATTNGSHQPEPASAPVAPPPPAVAERGREPAEAAPERSFHSEPRETSAAHEAAPLAHFEPAPRPEAAAAGKQPYVVWSSAPAKDGDVNRGPEE